MNRAKTAADALPVPAERLPEHVVLMLSGGLTVRFWGTGCVPVAHG
jgi:hypothetical protein